MERTRNQKGGQKAIINQKSICTTSRIAYFGMTSGTWSMVHMRDQERGHEQTGQEAGTSRSLQGRGSWAAFMCSSMPPFA
eukprot:1159652-Pelagomonas_calceolata.AAC.21